MIDLVENWLNNDMIGETGMVDNFDVSLSSSFIFLMKLELRETSKLSTIPVSPIKHYDAGERVDVLDDYDFPARIITETSVFEPRAFTWIAKSTFCKAKLHWKHFQMRW